MQPPHSVSSAIAFLARGEEDAVADSTVEEILGELDGDERAVLDAERLPQSQRLGRVRQQLGRDVSEAWLARVEARAFTHLRRALQRRGLLRG